MITNTAKFNISKDSEARRPVAAVTASLRHPRSKLNQRK